MVMAELRESDLKDLWLWLWRQRRRFRVTGDSMHPTLQAGDEVLVDLHAYQKAAPQPDELIVLLDPRDQAQKMVKRVQFVDENGRFYVSGDNPAASSDSRTFGTISTDLILGRVECYFGKREES